MITILHGENSTESRNAFSDLKKNESVLSIDGTTATVQTLSEKLEGQGLFGETQIIVIENLFSKKKGSKDVETLVSYISTHEKDNKIVLWESKQLSLKQLHFFTGATVKKFDLPKEIFAFLESLYPQNGKKAIALFQSVLQTEDAEFVFFMMVRQVRMLLSLLEEENETIDEVARLAPWQKGKLVKQAKSFGKENLLVFFSSLFAVEKKLKTGTLAAPLDEIIDFLLANL